MREAQKGGITRDLQPLGRTQQSRILGKTLHREIAIFSFNAVNVISGRKAQLKELSGEKGEGEGEEGSTEGGNNSRSTTPGENSTTPRPGSRGSVEDLVGKLSGKLPELKEIKEPKLIQLQPGQVRWDIYKIMNLCECIKMWSWLKTPKMRVIVAVRVCKFFQPSLDCSPPDILATFLNIYVRYLKNLVT